MEEEFQESDVVFSDSHWNTKNQLGNTIRNNQKRQRQRQQGAEGGHSPPLDIPAAARYKNGVMGFVHNNNNNNNNNVIYDDDNEDDDEEDLRMPPHLIVAQRINNYYYNVSRKMACSFCIEDEKGRLLKGRNLCQVRNSILRLTGFYET